MSSQVPQEFEDDGDWVERFIQAVESKPPIYNTSLPEHSDRSLILRLWGEICETMFPTWQEMTTKEKTTKGKDLQNRWRNLRTCFRRELSKQKQGKSGQATNKRRKYVYFDQLLFLLPTMKDRPTVTECSPQGNNSDSEDDSPIQATDHLDLESVVCNKLPQAGTSAQQSTSSYKKAKTKKMSTYEESLLNILKEKKEETIDEDKSFLLSLVPTFKKLNDAQKIDAKMEFLSILKRLAQPRPQTSYHMSQGHMTYPRYGYHGFAEKYLPQQIPASHFNYSAENFSSESSTPIPLPSDVSQTSRGSSFESATAHQDIVDFS